MRTYGLSLLVLLSCALADTPAHGADIEFVDPRAAAKLVKWRVAVLVDVREQAEIARGMAAPAYWMPTSRINADEAVFKAFLSRFDEDVRFIFYCAAGGRAARAALHAEALGRKAAAMAPYSEWVAAGLPTRRP